MGGNNSTAKKFPAREDLRRIMQMHHGLNVAARLNEPEVNLNHNLNRGLQRLCIESRRREILSNVHVRASSAKSSFYRCVIPRSLKILKMSKRNDEHFQHLLNYNSFVVHKPQPGFPVNGYAFLSTPISPAALNFSFVVKLAGERLSHFPNGLNSGLKIGFTSCDPKSISWAELPYKNVEDLDKRNEYWIWNDRFETESRIYDEFCFTVKSTGDVFYSKNGGRTFFLFHVDRSIRIWPFFVLSGKFTEIRVLGKILIPQAEIDSMTTQIPSAPLTNVVSPPQILLSSTPRTRLENLRIPSLSLSINSSTQENLDNLLPPPPRSNPPKNRQTQILISHDNGRGRGGRGQSQGPGRGFRGNRGQRGANNGAWILENQLRFLGNGNNNGERQPLANRGQGQNRGQRGRGRGQRSIGDQNPGFNQINNLGRGGQFRGRGRSQSNQAPRPSAEVSQNETVEANENRQEDSSNANSLCIICYESEKNCIFVPCNHNCMCFECGNEYFQRKKNEALGGQNPECPICRSQSTSVLRIYTT